MSSRLGVTLDRVPGLQPPPGVTPNFVNPENYQNTLIAALTIFLPIATIITAAKLYTGAFIVKSIAWEDCKYSLPLLEKHLLIRLQMFLLQHGYGITYTISITVRGPSMSCSYSYLLWKVGYVAFTDLFAITLQYGNGVHQWNVPLSNVFEFLKASILQ